MDPDEKQICLLYIYVLIEEEEEEDLLDLTNHTVIYLIYAMTVTLLVHLCNW